MKASTPRFQTLVRVGYFSRAVLYVMLGFIALTGAQSIAGGTEGIFKAIEAMPAGVPLLWVLAIGLAAYGFFRLASLLFDIERYGSDAKGWAHRIGHAGSGLAHFVLAWTAWQFATGEPSGNGDGASQAAAGVLSFPFGSIVLAILGLALLAGAAAQAKKAISGSFMDRIAANAPRFTKPVGTAGYLARAVVYVIIGWSLIQAGLLGEGAGRVKTLGDAVASLAGTGGLFTIVAVGLLMFGLFSMVLVRYRIIPELDTRRGIAGLRPQR